jgi:hypothetical protein
MLAITQIHLFGVYHHICSPHIPESVYARLEHPSHCDYIAQSLVAGRIKEVLCASDQEKVKQHSQQQQQ